MYVMIQKRQLVHTPFFFWIVRNFIMLTVTSNTMFHQCRCHGWNIRETTRIHSTFLGSHRFRLFYSFESQHQHHLINKNHNKRSYTSFWSRPSRISMMPEGPEVRTYIDQFQQSGMIGHRLVDFQFLSGRYVKHGRPKGFDDFAKTMTPWFPTTRTNSIRPTTTTNDDNNAIVEMTTTTHVDIIQEWNAKGKFIYMILDDGKNPPAYTKGDGYQRSIWITLGMTGRFVNEHIHLQDPRYARWMIEVLDPHTERIRKIFYHDSRNFGTLRFCLSTEELQDKLQSLGYDILNPQTTTVDTFFNLINLQRPELNVCQFLMDQSKLSGIGNYILSECLYRANLDPFASLSEFNEEEYRRLFVEAQAVAMESYNAQGLTRKNGGTYRTIDGDKGTYEFQLQCYGRDQCIKGRPVLTEKNGPHKRAIWYVEDQLIMPIEERRKGGGGRRRTIIPTMVPSPSSLPVVVSEEKSPTTTVESNILPSRDTAGNNNNINDDETSSPTTTTTTSFHQLKDELIDESWKKVLSKAMESDSFYKLQEFLIQEEESSGRTIFPPRHQIFSALNLCPFHKVKVVICGQDPYHGYGQGHGLAFSIQKGVYPFPPSLKNIIREVIDDVDIPYPDHGNLESWAKQGILLLNTVLTVRQGEANSHKGQGWEEFTDEIIRVLLLKNEDEEEEEGRQIKGIVFLLWGNPAAKKAEAVNINNYDLIHTVIRTSHPSPLGATKTNSPFLSSRCFSRTNDALRAMGHEPIDWTIR